METRLQSAERFSKIWWKSRADGKKSQEYMALSIGVSKKTVQNWEKGISSPDLFQSTEWFKALGLNPITYYLEFLYPEISKELNNLNRDQDEVLINFIEAMDENQKANLIYVLMGNYGGSYRAILEFMCAYCHLPLRERTMIAKVVRDSYELYRDSDGILCKDDKLPLMDILNMAIDSSNKAVIQGHSGYTIQHSEE